MYLIGLTGNIASGKSTVRQILSGLGGYAIDADALAHAAILRGTPTWRAVVDMFGSDILRPNGEIDRKKLGALVFQNPDALSKLEAITHPAVGELLRAELSKARDNPIVVVEAVKLYEAGLHEWCDALWVVTCEPADKQARLMQTRRLDESTADARLQAQPALAEKLARANVVIDNSGSREATRQQVARAFVAIDPQQAKDKAFLWLSAPSVEPARVSELPPKIQPPPPRARPAPLPSPPLIPTPLPARRPPLEAPAEVVIPPRVEVTRAVEPIAVRRVKRTDLALLASLLAVVQGRDEPLGRPEALRRFGSWGYWLAEAGEDAVGLAAWQAENLVAVVRDVWLGEASRRSEILAPLVAAIENEASGLQCEVSILLLPANAAEFWTPLVEPLGYQPRDLADLYRVWREVARARLAGDERLYVKRLREHLVTKPI